MTYVATQAPLADTAEDFWQLIWQTKCQVIVMLTALKEGGKVLIQQLLYTDTFSRFLTFYNEKLYRFVE